MEDPAIKTATDRVTAIVARRSGRSPASIGPETRLLHDLGLYGDDAEEVLMELERDFQINHAGFEFHRYFFPEGFALWMMPGFIWRRITAWKRPLTIAALVRSAVSGRWQLTEAGRSGLDRFGAGGA